jgi:hypothetical protein
MTRSLLCQHSAHPDATHFNTWHRRGDQVIHIDSDKPVPQSLIDALHLLADGCTVPAPCVDQEVSDDRCGPDHRGSPAGPGGSHE